MSTPIIVNGAGKALKISLTDKWMKKPFRTSVVGPFVNTCNKNKGTDLAADKVKACNVDGVDLDLADLDAPAESLLKTQPHLVVLAFDEETPGDAVARVLDAADEFATLGLPVAATETAAVRKAYKRVSLQVHPDKNADPKAEDAFKKVFNAMKLLVDPAQQRGCLRKARGGDGAGGGDDLPDEFKWWAGKSSVHEMEQAFRNLEEYLDAKGAFGERVDDNLWVEPQDAADCVFVDARDVMAYVTSRIPGALSMPGHTMAELQALTRHHPVIRKLSNENHKRVAVYSDNGSMMSRCVHVARALRAALPDPERVRRLRGGLNGWKRLGLDVQGDERAQFAGKAAAPDRLT